jgi:hypothetical protein
MVTGNTGDLFFHEIEIQLPREPQRSTNLHKGFLREPMWLLRDLCVMDLWKFEGKFMSLEWQSRDLTWQRLPQEQFQKPIR